MRRSTRLGSHNDTLLCTLDRIDAGGLHVLCKNASPEGKETRNPRATRNAWVTLPRKPSGLKVAETTVSTATLPS